MSHIRHIRITPIAFADPPLLNAAGIHEPWALRAIIELETDCGRVGINETYGDAPMLAALARAQPCVQGLQPWDLNAMQTRVAQAFAATASVAAAPEFLGTHISLAPGTHASKTVAKVVSAFEVAMLDLQGQMAHAPVVDVLGGAVRSAVPFSAYLFFKHAQHKDHPGAPDPWGQGTSPAQIVAQAQRMVAQHGFQSLKLKGGALPPAQEVQTLQALAAAFPALPLRIDPNANWCVATSVAVAQQVGGLLEYLEDPAPGLDGMAQVGRALKDMGRDVPLATNMVVTDFAELAANVRAGCPVRIVLSDHHYWGGMRATQQLARVCSSFDMALSMHSNSHLGISLVAMAHLAASVPHLAYACDTHYPWQSDEVIAGGRLQFEAGSLRVPRAPGLGVTIDPQALALLHDNYLHCGIRQRNDLAQMQRHDPSFTGAQPRF